MDRSRPRNCHSQRLAVLAVISKPKPVNSNFDFSGIVNTCVFLQKLSISGEEIKLEAESPAYAVCNPHQTLIGETPADVKAAVPITSDNDRGHVAHNQQPAGQESDPNNLIVPVVPDAPAVNDKDDDKDSEADGDEDEPMSGGENVLQRQKELDEMEPFKPESEVKDDGKTAEDIVLPMPGADFNDIAEGDPNVKPEGGDKEGDGAAEKNGDPESEADKEGEDKVEEANVGPQNSEAIPNVGQTQPDQAPSILAKAPELGQGTEPIDSDTQKVRIFRSF